MIEWQNTKPTKTNPGQAFNGQEVCSMLFLTLLLGGSDAVAAGEGLCKLTRPMELNPTLPCPLVPRDSPRGRVKFLLAAVDHPFSRQVSA